MKTREQISNIRRLADHIEGLPVGGFKWMRATISHDPHCGTVGCVAGHAVVLLDKDWVAENWSVVNADHLPSSLPRDEHLIRAWSAISTRARNLLNLTHAEAALFTPMGWTPLAQALDPYLSKPLPLRMSFEGGEETAVVLLRAIADRAEAELAVAESAEVEQVKEVLELV